jgi:hypothetical protein
MLPGDHLARLDGADQRPRLPGGQLEHLTGQRVTLQPAA